MIFQLLLPREMFAADLAIRMFRFCVNFFVRGAGSLVRESFLAETAFITVNERQVS